MKRFALATFALLAFAGPSLAQQCNPYCTQQLQLRGAQPFEIQRACCQFLPAPQVGQRCSSPAGQCIMPQPIPLGSPCYCPTPFGPAGGQITP